MPLPENSSQLPVIRYKVRVEHAGAASSSSSCDQATEATPGTSNGTSTTNNTKTTVGKADTTRESATPDADTNEQDDNDNRGFANPAQIARMVLVPAREAAAAAAQSTARAFVAEGGQEQQQRTFVTVRGLKPATTYRVQVGRVFLSFFLQVLLCGTEAAAKLQEEAGRGGGWRGLFPFHHVYTARARYYSVRWLLGYVLSLSFCALLRTYLARWLHCFFAPSPYHYSRDYCHVSALDRQVAAVNAVGFGPYGAPSVAVVTPEKEEEEQEEGEREGGGGRSACLRACVSTLR